MAAKKVKPNSSICEFKLIPEGYRKSQNPLTAEVAKEIRKDRKKLIIRLLSLRPLRKPLRALRLRGLFR
jgi:hypothetical protein